MTSFIGGIERRVKVARRRADEIYGADKHWNGRAEILCFTAGIAVKLWEMGYFIDTASGQVFTAFSLLVAARSR